MTDKAQSRADAGLRERVRDYIYDCTRDEFQHGWTLSAEQADHVIALASTNLTEIERLRAEVADMLVAAWRDGAKSVHEFLAKQTDEDRACLLRATMVGALRQAADVLEGMEL